MFFNEKKLEVLPRAAVAAIALIGMGTAVAQHGAAPSPDRTAAFEARAGVAAIGKQWNAQVNADTTRLYTALQHHVDSSGIRQIADLSYGPHEQQTFDLFVPEGGFSEPSTVLIYLHGGGLSRGDKNTEGSDGLIYGNVGRWIARAGGIGINANYRLVPDAKWPSGAEDIRLLLEWVRENIGPYGGDPNNVVLMGNSAGATHLATYLFHEPSQLQDGPGITAAILSSGAFGQAAESDAARAYYGEDGAARMPLALVDSYQGKAVPVLLWSAEYDVPSIEAGVAEMYAKLCRKYEDCPMFVQFQGHNHVSHVMSIDSADMEVANVIMRFYHTVIDRR
jgi:triacylglycerol lipase